jgi:hypothetical protein
VSYNATAVQNLQPNYIIAQRVFRIEIISLRYKNTQAYNNAGFVVVDSKFKVSYVSFSSVTTDPVMMATTKKRYALKQ